MSKITKSFTFKNSKDNGDLAGKTLSHTVPLFDWEKFKSASNAKLFIEKAFDAALQKLVREVHLCKNGTRDVHLQSIESVIARSIKITKAEIEQWCRERDWNSAEIKMDKVKAAKLLLEELPKYSSDDHVITNEEKRRRIAEIIAGVSDVNADPVAEYLWVKLTQSVEGSFALEGLL
jgi:HD-GYP domain-containing protein (c-di-GMP phosphodiesterase class II)